MSETEVVEVTAPVVEEETLPVNVLDMTPEESIREHLSSRVGGAEGSAKSMAIIAARYKLDKTLLPSFMGEQKSGVAISNYGGFIAAKYGIDPLFIHKTWRVIISKSYAALDDSWHLNKQEFSDMMNILATVVANTAETKKVTDAFNGVPATNVAKELGKSAKEFRRILTSKEHITRPTIDALRANVIELRQLLEQLESLSL